ncbi:MAG: penicillin-binding protein 2 [Candidatus Babeliales bacterium]
MNSIGHAQRCIHVMAVMGFVFCIFVMRLFYLQLYLQDIFFKKAQKNFTRTSTIPPQRGNILDCHGTLLATNRPITMLYWHGSGNRQLSAEQTALLAHLSTILNKDMQETEFLTRLKYAERMAREIMIIHDIPLELLSKVMEKFPNHPNLSVREETKRLYPHHTIACHTLGYIGSMQESGKMGLEYLFETNLRGQEGQRMTMINSLGSSLRQEELSKAFSGENIQTTLDLNLQKIAERCFDKNLSGAFILIDPLSGALKAMFSRPTFDPNIFLEPLDQETWNSLQSKRPFLNRCFNATYPPASLFKVVTMSAALELDIINHDTTSLCSGYIEFGGRRYHCNKRAGHGELSITEWIAKSCNIPFYEIGKRISIDQLADYAFRFGLGQKTDVVFGEQSGLVPTSVWKQETKGERWWPGETLSATIGQSYFLATPIQVARMIGSIFTGYLAKPRILMNEPIMRTDLAMKPETRKVLKKSLKSVVTQGTGSYVSTVQDIKIYAKTGTAQISSLAKRWRDAQYKEHAWFVSYFTYKDEDPLVLVLLVEHAGTSRAATSIAKRFLMNYRSYKEKA